MKREHLYRVLQVALLLVVAVLVWKRLRPELARVSPADFARWRPALWPLVLSTVGLTLLHLAQALLWRRVLVDVGSPRPNLRTTIRVYFVSGLARFIPGSFWQFASLAVLGEQAGIAPLPAAAAGAIGNATFLATGVVFLAFTLPGAPGAAGMLAGVVAAAAALAGIFAFTGSAAGARLRDWLGRRAPARLLPALQLAGRIRPGHAVVWTLGYGACWLLLGASFVTFVTAFVPATVAHSRELGGIMAASYLVGFLVLFAPSGIGAREGMMAWLLAGFVPGPAAIVIAVAQRIWFFVAELLAMGTFALFPRQPADRSGDDRGRSGERTMTEVP